MNLSIIIPAHNEEESIAQVIARIEEKISLAHEIVVVNDHSCDRTADIVKDLSMQYKNNIRLVENLGNAGFANALMTGFTNTNMDIVVPVMADLCDDIDTINRMYEKALEGFDVICGSRYMRGGIRLGGSRLKGFLSSFAGRSLYYLLGIPTHDIANAFKMYRKKVIDDIELKAKGFDISMEIPLKAHYSGYKITEVPTVWRERTKGKSSFKIFKLLPDYLKLYSWAVFKNITR